jgi:2-dehydropantoate 2-reductase
VLRSLPVSQSVKRPPRVLILGTGAMACALGARLARYGRAAVTLAGTWTEGLAAIGTRGIAVDEPSGPWTASVRVSPLQGPLGPADFVLVLVKSHRTAAVASTAARSLLPRSVLVTLQNGLGNHESLVAACGPDHVAVGVSSMSAHLVAPGEVRVVPGRFFLGDHVPGVARFAELVAASRLEVEVHSEIDRMIWGKLAVTCAIDPLSALTGRTCGQLLETPEPCETLLKAAREVGTVALAHGVDLGGDPATLAVEAAESSGSTRSAMSNDLLRGFRTEIDAQNGAVVEGGARFGIPTPVNEYLWQEVRAREGRGSGPPAERATS